LPKVSEVINEEPNTQQPPRIVSSSGLLSPEKSKAILEQLDKLHQPTDLLQRHNYVMEQVSENPVTKGNKVVLLVDGQATYAAMYKIIKNAKDHINLETFIFDDDEVGRRFSDLLIQKQTEGVQVNIIYDKFGNLNDPVSFFERLRHAGIQVVEINPINPLPIRGEWRLANVDHRKLLIVDGKVAITGGVNISKVYSSTPSDRDEERAEPLPWRDTDVLIEGPAVAEFQKLFFDTWRKQKGPKLSGHSYFPSLKEEGNALVQVIGSTPGQNNRATFIVYVAAITFAEHSVHLTNAYFVPDEQVLKALGDAARRGVDVKILLPATSDSSLALYAARYNYSELLEAGVKIYERRNALLHAKTAVIDGVWSTVGSTNLDFWSLLSDDEVNAVILSHKFADEMEMLFSTDLSEADAIRSESWEKRSYLERMREQFSHLFARWL
jgi:cardiolipin synthase